MKSSLIVLFCLVLLNCFGLTHFSYVNYGLSIIFILLMVCQVWMTRALKTPYDTGLTLVVVGCFCSIFSSVYYEGTDMWKDFIAYYYIFAILFVLVLNATRTSGREAERATIILALMLCGLYIAQYTAVQYGTSILPKKEDADLEEASDLRLRMIGSAFSAFAVFYGLNKYIVTKDRTRKMLMAGFAGLGFVVITLMAFRTMFVGLGVCVVLLCYKIFGRTRQFFKYITIILLTATAAYFTPVIRNKIDYAVQKQMAGTETLANENYARIRGLQYYTQEHFKDNVEYFFGSGLTTQKKGKYAVNLDKLASQHMMWVDWGLIGLSWMTGVLTVLGMMIYCYRVCRIRYAPENKYIYVFFVYLVMISILTNEFARPGNFVVQALVLYLAQCNGLGVEVRKKKRATFNPFAVRVNKGFD